MTVADIERWERRRAGRVEISDEIVAFDPETLARLPVDKAAVVARLRAVSDRRAARIVERLPAHPDGTLDPGGVDRTLLAAHCEMQRVSEEFLHGERVACLLRPLLTVLRRQVKDRRLIVADIGCGTGFVVRWLAARGGLGPDVRLLGLDFNPALVAEASRLAALENLDCAFAVRNAFTMPETADVYLSTGVLHHFPPAALPGFFAAHERPGTSAFLHFDFQPSFHAVPGSWLFHYLRMREPLARHDGVMSARRVYDGAILSASARAGAPGFRCGVFGARLYRTPVPRVFHTLVGVRPEIADAFVAALGPGLSGRMGELA